jgi:2-polyprenyl-6-methoxyphenol hydroxylase-like FAD-dependent oxidoreductase
MARGHAAVAGAGVAGLIAAIALAQRGWSVSVHERASDLRSYGAGISCWYNFTKVLKAVGVYERCAANCRPLYVRETRDEHNRVLYSIRGADHPSERALLLTRRDLLEALGDRARSAGAEILLSSRVVGADPAGSLILEDGSIRKADLVIGADGVNSPVRDSVGLLRVRRPLTQGAVRLLIPRLSEERRSEDGRKSIEYWSGFRRLYYSACNEDEVYLAFMVQVNDAEGRATPIGKAAWKASFPLLNDLIDRVGNDGRWDPFEHVSLHRWSRGRVALVGDAATAMAPNIGQGGGMAAVNALALAVHVSASRTVEEGLERWEVRERPLSEYTQRVSYWYGRLNDMPPGIRANAMRLLGRSKLAVDLRQRPAHHVPLGYVPTVPPVIL